MDESRHTSEPLPPPALCGFLLLLTILFGVSYAVGTASGPVAPGLHSTTGTSGGGTDGGGSGDTEHGHEGGG